MLLRSLSIPHRNVHRWLPGYVRSRLHRLTAASHDGPTHLLVAVCDHYEPLWGNAPPEKGRERALAAEAPDDALGGVGFGGVHAGMVTKFSLVMQDAGPAGALEGGI